MTTVPPAWEFPDLLRPDGVGPIDFGTPIDIALAEILADIGPPTSTEILAGSDLYQSVTEVRVLTWDDLSLRLVFTDWGGDSDPPVAVPLHLSDWEIFGPGLATTHGIGYGSTTADVRAVYPKARFGINEFSPMFWVATESGTITGSVSWPSYEAFDEAMQAALAAHGYPTDGTPGSGTGQALLDFMNARGGHQDASDVMTLLGLPPHDIPVTWMHAGAGPLCC